MMLVSIRFFASGHTEVVDHSCQIYVTPMLHLLVCSKEKKKPHKCVFLQQSDKQLTMLKVPTYPGSEEGGPLLRRARPMPHLPAMPGRLRPGCWPAGWPGRPLLA